jgi:alkylation response protein AidB-like acyl-CoA dehydrogenase
MIPRRWLQQSTSAAVFIYGNTYCDDPISEQRFLFDWLGEFVQSFHSMSVLSPCIRTLLVNVSGMVPQMQRNAETLDAKAEFPRIELDDLRAAGAFSAVVPQRLGGLGLGTEPSGALGAFELLRLIGRGSLAVGRIFEGHMNALRLISLYGREEQLRRAADDTRAGHLFSIWNTERPPEAVRIVGSSVGLALQGSKFFCSGAGYATRGLITAGTVAGTRQMLVIALEPGERAASIESMTQGMRATATGRINLDGLPIESSDFIGGADDYLREPAFSGGAWRTCAVMLGGIEALIEFARRQLIDRDRHQSPFQQARMGRAFIAGETIRLWTVRAAQTAETNEAGLEEIAAYVNFTRTGVEASALEIIRLIQQSIGLAAFTHPNPIERLMRDLSTYLRQPAPDEALTEAAAWFIEHGAPLLR